MIKKMQNFTFFRFLFFRRNLHLQYCPGNAKVKQEKRVNILKPSDVLKIVFSEMSLFSFTSREDFGLALCLRPIFFTLSKLKSEYCMILAIMPFCLILTHEIVE